MNKAKKVMVVDDEADIRKVVGVRFEISDYNVIEAADGADALDKAKKERPDLIILDLMLPKITGFELCRMLKFDEECKKIPILILSALGQETDRDKAMKNGADAYMTKPFDLEVLVKKAEGLMKR